MNARNENARLRLELAEMDLGIWPTTRTSYTHTRDGNWRPITRRCIIRARSYTELTELREVIRLVRERSRMEAAKRDC